MEPSTLLILARQGDAGAIATLLDRALRQHQITASVTLQPDGIDIVLVAPVEPAAKSSLPLIQRALTQICCPQICWVRVSGQAADAVFPGWAEELQLAPTGPVSSSTPDADLPTASRPHAALAQFSTPDRSLSGQSPFVAAITPASRPVFAKSRPNPAHQLNALVVGLGLGILAFVIPLFNVLMRGFLVLVHEVGHAVTHWLFGRPALPTVNLLHGGGITLAWEQSAWLVGLVYLAISALAYLSRSWPMGLGAIAAFTAFYTYCLATPLNQALAILMGHGMELVAIVVCLYLSASGRFCKFTGDRTIYAMLGFFTFFSDFRFAWQLTHSPEIRESYEAGIGGVIDNDFVRLANDYFGVNLSTIAGAFFLACLAAPAIAAILWYFDARLGNLGRS
jgi:hypothetical protein